MPNIYFTDKNGCHPKREIFETEKMAGITTLGISENSVNEGFLGFGVAITGASCYLLTRK